MTLSPIDDPAAFAATRESWHKLAEHVLARARWEATGKIGLRPYGFGVTTPHYGDDQRAALTAEGIVLEQYGETAVAPITTLAAAAAFLGTPLGAPEGVYEPTTTCVADAAARNRRSGRAVARRVVPLRARCVVGLARRTSRRHAVAVAAVAGALRRSCRRGRRGVGPACELRRVAR